ncbi:HNH endonuclease signature motif containing protein [Kytococcus sp. Marseille-QA3725]
MTGSAGGVVSPVRWRTPGPRATRRRSTGWCHAHHIRHWADGGATDLANLALLCQRHHTVVHRERLTANRDGGRWVWHDASDPPEPLDAGLSPPGPG